MTEWLRLGDLKHLPEGKGEPDIVLGVLLSPYDAPEAIRGLRDERGHFRIEFRYIDGEEQGKPVRVGPHILATEGRYTGRLLSMEIDIDALGAKSVGVAFETAVPQQRIKNTLEHAWEELFNRYAGQSKERGAIAATARRAASMREHDLLGQLAAT